MNRISPAQKRLLDLVRACEQAGIDAEYWPVVNDWMNHGVNEELAFRNHNRTIDSLVRRGELVVDEGGYFRIPTKD